MSENCIYKITNSLNVPYTAADSIDNGIDGLTVKIAIKNLYTGMFWDHSSGFFDSLVEVLNSATGLGDGLYRYQLSNGYIAGEGPYRVHVEATETVTGDIADKTVVQTLSEDVDIPAIKSKTDNLPHSIKKNTAISNFKLVMLDSATGNPKSGLIITATKKLDADVSWGAMTGSQVDNGDGAYSFDINAADTNGDTGIFKFTASGAKTTFISFMTEAV
jgi:hypothetical protein